MGNKQGAESYVFEGKHREASASITSVSAVKFFVNSQTYFQYTQTL